MQKIFYSLLLFFLFTISGFCQKYEAESALLAGGATKQASSTASGGYYVAQGDGNLTFNLNFETEATYNLYIQVASPSGYKANNLVVDGTSITFATNQNASYIR